MFFLMDVKDEFRVKARNREESREISRQEIHVDIPVNGSAIGLQHPKLHDGPAWQGFLGKPGPPDSRRSTGCLPLELCDPWHKHVDDHPHRWT